jgi:hypothetical protein
MNSKFLNIIFILFTVFALLGCATTSKVTKIDQGMNKAQVAATIGHPYKKATFTDKKGNQIDVWSYQETMWDNGGWSPNKTIVSSDVVFVNGTVNNIATRPDQHLIYNPVFPTTFAPQPVIINQQPQFMQLGHSTPRVQNFSGTVYGPNGQMSTYNGTSY